MFVEHEAHGGHRAGPEPGSARGIEGVREDVDAVAVLDPVREAHRLSVGQDEVDLGMGHAEGLDEVLHAGRQAEGLDEDLASPVWGQVVLEVPVEAEPGRAAQPGRHPPSKAARRTGSRWGPHPPGGPSKTPGQAVSQRRQRPSAVRR